MKLYATVQSERASKGQGGNKFIRFTLKDESKQVQLRLQIVQQADDLATYELYEHETGKVVYSSHFATKGKQQKGEYCVNPSCKEHSY